MKIYFKIWTDCILKARSLPGNSKNWKFYTLIYMSIAMSLNAILLRAVLERNVFNSNFYSLEIDVFPGSKLDALLSFMILYFIPIVILNYILIFWRKNYDDLIKKYKYYNGKLFIGYFLISIFLPFLLLFLGFILEYL